MVRSIAKRYKGNFLQTFCGTLLVSFYALNFGKVCINGDILFQRCAEYELSYAKLVNH